MILRLGSLAAVLLACGYCTAAKAQPVSFEQHVRPILKLHCFQCHGEEDEKQANLDLRQTRLIIKGGDSGPAIVPGNAARSLLIEKLAASEMPPDGKGKPLSAEQLATIRTWIDQGSKTARPEPETLSAVTDAERSFWSFQPLKRPPLPAVREAALLHSPIDAFLSEKLEQRGLAFSPAADRAALIRRASFDLHGLPPTPEEVAVFSADDSPDAWERLLDRLLASPRYGERWGRHWLDVAGYADSDGYTEKDPERNYAFKYRDYVIRSLNADQPWDAFLREQLAGDEMLTQPFANLTAEQADLLAATGFLRMAPDGTADGNVDQAAARNDVVAETLKIVSSSLLGLTVGCAQCHDHRYDPIPQVDYYRLRAIFEPALDVKGWRTPQGRLVSLWTDAVREQAAAVDADVKKVADERQAEMDGIVAAIFDAEVEKLPEEQRELARQARAADAKERTSEQKQLLKNHPSLNVSRGSAYLYDRQRVDAFNKDFDARTRELQARRPVDDFVPCLYETPGKIPQTVLFFRGDIQQPRQAVEPSELSVLTTAAAMIPQDDPALPTSGRRLAYARWLTSGQQPLTPRVLVNRFWLHHFGRGIVATPGDFGVLGARPSHPELLDWLAARFIDSGWELKRLHRLLMSSTVYQQQSRRTNELDQADPENQLLGRMSIRRLEAEAVRDAMLAAAGSLNLKMQGPPVPVTVDDVGQVIVGLDNRDTAGRPMGKRGVLGADEFRRSIYIQVRRSLPLSMLETFDAPLLNPNCELRTRSTVAPQSLLLMNSEFVLGQSRTLAARAQSASSDRSEQIRLLWRWALAAEPADEKISKAAAYVAAQEAELAENNKDQALAGLCQALFSSSAFLYVD